MQKCNTGVSLQCVTSVSNLSTHLIALFSIRSNRITIAGLTTHSTCNFPVVLSTLVTVQANHIWSTRALPCLAITWTCFCIRAQQVACALCMKQSIMNQISNQKTEEKKSIQKGDEILPNATYTSFCRRLNIWWLYK